MITKNSIYKLIKNFETLITSEDFKIKRCKEKSAFTRNRKLSFQDVVLFLLGLPRKSLPTELDLYFESRNMSISKQTFSKARYQISESAFKEIFQLTTDINKLTNNPKTWDGFRIFAVDGSDIAVPHNKETEKVFGLFNNNNAEYPIARLTELYDVTNDLIADIHFTGTNIGEREHAQNLLVSPALVKTDKYKNLIPFDRGYPSRSLIHELEDKGLYYVIRCYRSFISCVNECPEGDHIVTDQFKGRATTLRVIKNTINNETHILVSNLFEQHQDTKYHQDLYATLFISNLSSLIKAVSEHEIKNEMNTPKHKYQLNKSYTIGIVSRYIKSVITSYDYRKNLIP